MMLPITYRHVYAVGARVRLLVNAPSAWPDSSDPMESFGVEIGHLGTVTSVHAYGAYSWCYGVRLDGDPHPPHLSASFRSDELELAEESHITREPVLGTRPAATEEK